MSVLYKLQVLESEEKRWVGKEAVQIETETVISKLFKCFAKLVYLEKFINGEQIKKNWK